jgi:hypothetical protein
MKAKLKVKDKIKFKFAAELADVKINNLTTFGNNAQALVTYRTPQQLFEMGEYMASVEAPVLEIKEETKQEAREIKSGKEVKQDAGKK